jgi:hypothetical protein
MLMLGRLIMNLTGERESWDYTSLFVGMAGGGGGFAGGGFGGGGLGGGGFGGGVGGGFRSVPPTAPPSALVPPGQTRKLPTRLVALNGPSDELRVPVPQKGERLVIANIDETAAQPRIKTAVKQLAASKAPETIAQIALWHMNAGLDWPTLEKISCRWANSAERALARQFVDELESMGTSEAIADPATIFLDIATGDSRTEALRKCLDGRSLLGLSIRFEARARPIGPSLA